MPFEIKAILAGTAPYRLPFAERLRRSMTLGRSQPARHDELTPRTEIDTLNPLE